MKKLFTILSLILVCNIANAQRQLDIAVTKITNPTGGIIHSGVPFTFKGVITNVSNATVKVSDTILYKFYVLTPSGSRLIFADPSASGYYYKLGRNKQLLKNDTMNFSYTNTVTYAFPADSLYATCLAATVIGSTSDAAEDTVTANNIFCDTTTFKMHTSAIPSVTNGTNVTKVFLFPSPAQNVANFDLDVVSAIQVTINIYDMVGRLVTTKNVGTLSAGQHSIPVNTTELPNGVYIYNVISGTEISSGKFSIAK
jgi:hypothetical protein